MIPLADDKRQGNLTSKRRWSLRLHDRKLVDTLNPACSRRRYPLGRGGGARCIRARHIRVYISMMLAHNRLTIYQERKGREMEMADGFKGTSRCVFANGTQSSDAENVRVHDLDIPGAVQLAKWSGVSASTRHVVRVTDLGGRRSSERREDSTLRVNEAGRRENRNREGNRTDEAAWRK